MHTQTHFENSVAISFSLCVFILSIDKDFCTVKSLVFHVPYFPETTLLFYLFYFFMIFLLNIYYLFIYIYYHVLSFQNIYITFQRSLCYFQLRREFYFIYLQIYIYIDFKVMFEHQWEVIF